MRLLGARVTRPIFLDDGTWMQHGDKCLPKSPLRRGLVIKAERDEITVRWDDGKEQVLLSHAVLPNKKLDTVGNYELLSIELSPEIKDARYLKMLNPSIGIFHLEGVDPSCDTVEKSLNWRNENRFANAEVLT